MMRAVELDCLFCKIVAREIPSTIVYETDDVLAFRDINPQAPTHVCVIPKTHLVNAAALAEHPALASAVLAAAAEVAAADGVEGGYRLVFNTGPAAGQSVPHVHGHVLGGRSLAWPPG
jgi:histidine triad (HIT) family protein